MEVILLERVAKLGQMGEIVKVRDGFARNFLLKRKKALRATAENKAKYEGMKAELEANNIQAKSEASKVAEKIDGLEIIIIRQASETGQLFGSVSVRDIVVALAAENHTSAARRSGSTRRSRRSASRRSRSPSIRRSRRPSPSRSPAAPTKPSASSAARTSRPARKTRTRPPKRSPRPASSSIRKPSATTTSSRRLRSKRPTRSKPHSIKFVMAGLVPGMTTIFRKPGSHAGLSSFTGMRSPSIAIDASAVAVCFSTPSVTQ